MWPTVPAGLTSQKLGGEDRVQSITGKAFAQNPMGLWCRLFKRTQGSWPRSAQIPQTEQKGGFNKMPIGSFTLEKPVWTEADFEQMGWHDVRIHAVAFRAELFEFWLDVDYIFSWVHPHGEETHYRFWVAPATLVFTNVHGLNFSIESHDGSLSLQGISRSEPCPARNAEYLTKQTESLWVLDCNEGEIAFRSVGFSQFTRHAPVLLLTHQLTLEERGGISFARDYTA